MSLFPKKVEYPFNTLENVKALESKIESILSFYHVALLNI